MSRIKDTESFIKKSKEKYGDDALDYSEVNYIDKLTPVKLTCKKCGNTFYQAPAEHIRKRKTISCPKCAVKDSIERRALKEKEGWISDCMKKFGNKFDYSKVEYKNNKEKVWIYCNKCKKWFQQSPLEHLKSIHGCPYCGIEAMRVSKLLTLKTFIEKVEAMYGKDVYDFSKTVYKSYNEKIIISINSTGEEFITTPERLLRGYGNPINRSLGENIILGWINSNNLECKPEYYLRDEISNFLKIKIDIRILYNNIEYWIEYNGKQHYDPISMAKIAKDKLKIKEEFQTHSRYIRQVERDKAVRKYCEENGIVFIEIPYTYRTYKSIAEVLDRIIFGGENPDDVIKRIYPKPIE